MSDYDQYPPQGRGPGGSGISGRLLIALAIVLFALFSFWSSSQVNPVTGEKQHISISPKQEILLGLESAPQMSKKMGGELPSSDPRVQEVNKIGDLLVSRSQAAKSPWKFKFHVLGDRKTVNAFALPGGQIFITLGLYNLLQNEAQLAGVLGHEIGHVIERHTAQQMAKNQLGQLLVLAVGTGASGDQGSNRAAMVAAMVNQMVQLRYGRGDESQADIWGLQLLPQIGLNPEQMIEVMKVLKASGGKARGPEMFQTHPNPDLRIEQIQKYLKEHPQQQKGLSDGKDLKSVYRTGPDNTEDNDLQSLFNWGHQLGR